MPEMSIEQTSAGKTTTTKWWTPYVTPQTMLGVCAAFVWAVIFWKDSHDNWDKTNQKADIEDVRAIKEDLKTLRETVVKQYATAKEDRERENKAIEEVADWMHYERGRQAGYQQAMEELKKK